MVNQAGASTGIDVQWWNPKTRGGDPHPLVFSLFENIKARSEQLLSNTRALLSIYQWGYKAGESHNPEAEAAFNDDVVGFNCAANTVDTMHSKLCASRVVPMPFSVGGNYLERQLAKEMGKALDGEWDENDVERIWEDMCRDALTTAHGAGAAKVFPKGGGKREKCCVEFVPIDDIFFDPAEVRYRNPRSVIQRQRMDRFQALAEFAGPNTKGLHGTRSERRDAILAAPLAMDTNGIPVEANQIEVVEMWHLPSCPVDDEETEADEDEDEDADSPGADDEDGEYQKTDGRHFIGIENCTFVDEVYENEEFPIVLFTVRARPRHVLGLSLMWNLAGPQREYEKLSYRIQKAHHRMGGTHLYVKLGDNEELDVRQLDNEQGTVVVGTAEKPTELNPAACHPQTYDYKESLARDMNVKNGLSEMSTSSQVPAGLSQASGKALQVFEDTEDKRFVVPHRAKERALMGLAWRIVECCREIAERNPEYSSRYRGDGDVVEPIVWKKAMLARDRYVLKVMPAGPLSKSPAAKFEQLTELLNAGAITVEQFKREFGLPDLDNELDIDTADTDVVDFVLNRMVTTGKYISPEPWDNFDLAKARCAKFINLCRRKDVPDGRIKLLHDYWEDADAMQQALIKKAAENAAPPPGPAGMAPPGAGPMPGGAPPDLPGAMPAMAAGPPPPVAM